MIKHENVYYTELNITRPICRMWKVGHDYVIHLVCLCACVSVFFSKVPCWLISPLFVESNEEVMVVEI